MILPRVFFGFSFTLLMFYTPRAALYFEYNKLNIDKAVACPEKVISEHVITKTYFIYMNSDEDNGGGGGGTVGHGHRESR